MFGRFLTRSGGSAAAGVALLLASLLQAAPIFAAELVVDNSDGAVMVKGTGAEPDRKHGARNPRLLVFLLATKRRGACKKARGDVA